MASLLGGHVPIDCPVCPDQVDVPIRQVGGDGEIETVECGHNDLIVTIEVDLSAWLQHIEAAHARRTS
jgi:hypothetical protein